MVALGRNTRELSDTHPHTTEAGTTLTIAVHFTLQSSVSSHRETVSSLGELTEILLLTGFYSLEECQLGGFVMCLYSSSLILNQSCIIIYIDRELSMPISQSPLSN